MPAREVVPKFMRRQNRQQRERKKKPLCERLQITAGGFGDHRDYRGEQQADAARIILHVGLYRECRARKRGADSRNKQQERMEQNTRAR